MELAMIVRAVAAGLVLVLGTPPAPAPTQPPLASVPFFAALLREHERVRPFSVPLHLSVSMHRFIFTFHFTMDGPARFQPPASYHVAIERVPPQYQRLFGELGTPQTWTQQYDLTVQSSSVIDGRLHYLISGVPRRPNDIKHLEIEVGGLHEPVIAHWILHGGWSVSSIIDTETAGNVIVTKEDRSQIVGHGYRIGTDMTYGEYVMQAD
jgi:hypothetical protein